MAVIPTFHAIVRMSQRGFGKDDIELIRYLASEVEGGYFVRNSDYQRFDREIKQVRNRAKRLIGKRIVLDGQSLVTAYHAKPAKTRKLLRNARETASID